MRRKPRRGCSVGVALHGAPGIANGIEQRFRPISASSVKVQTDKVAKGTASSPFHLIGVFSIHMITCWYLGEPHFLSNAMRTL